MEKLRRCEKKGIPLIFKKSFRREKSQEIMKSFNYLFLKSSYEDRRASTHIHLHATAARRSEALIINSVHIHPGPNTKARCHQHPKLAVLILRRKDEGPSRRRMDAGPARRRKDAGPSRRRKDVSPSIPRSLLTGPICRRKLPVLVGPSRRMRRRASLRHHAIIMKST